MKVIFWQPFLITHTSDTYRHFQSINAEETIFVLTQELPDHRIKQGWQIGSYSELNVINLHKRHRVKESIKILKDNQNGLNIFLGFWADRIYILLILHCLLHGIKFAIIAEAYSETPCGYSYEENKLISILKVKGRPLIYRYLAAILNLLSNKTSYCILTMSTIAREQYIKAGFPENSIYPFGYFVPKQKFASGIEDIAPIPFRVVFIGSLIKIKGLDIAVEVITEMKQNGVQIELDVYGMGDPSRFLSNSTTNIHYGGVLNHDSVQAIIPKYHALILPSRHDGWGVVVNEALLQGVPAIVSDRVGAKCLLESSDAGIIFKNEDTNDLYLGISGLVADMVKYQKMQDSAKAMGEIISPEIGATYLFDILNYHFHNLGHRPIPIWCMKTSSEAINLNSLSK